MQIQTYTCTYIHRYVWVCIVCIYLYCMYMYVLLVLRVCHCMVCICMYLHVLYVLNILYVWVCIVCICLYILKCFCRYIHIHTHTYIHTIQTKYRFVANACMCMYFWVNAYIIQTAGFTYIQIQTCRIPDEKTKPAEPFSRSNSDQSYQKTQCKDQPGPAGRCSSCTLGPSESQLGLHSGSGPGRHSTSVVWGIPNSYQIRYIINTHLNRHRLGVD